MSTSAGRFDGDGRAQRQVYMRQHLVSEVLHVRNGAGESGTIGGIEDQVLRPNAEAGAAGLDRAARHCDGLSVTEPATDFA